MRQLIFLSALLLVVFSWGCQNESQAEIDQRLIEDYLAANSLEADRDANGLYYRIEDPGGEARPNINSSIEIMYRGELLDGTVFDQSPEGQSRTFALGGLIPGWQLGLQRIGRGGKIHLYIPSRLGYGARVQDLIPANSVLVFEIDLIDF
ncbi:MAG: FKBP-type peptidyl-prolyl cis-trans isomerase [Bacteroidota bacterium]